MARQQQNKEASPLLKRVATVVGSVTLLSVTLPALGLIAVFLALWSPVIVPFVLAEGVTDAKHAHS